MVIAGMSPDPDARNPLNPAVAEAVQVKVVDETFDCNSTGTVVVPAQISCESTALVTIGIGYTVTTRFLGIPKQLAGAGPSGVIT
jgi:hypothetical protein